MPVVLLFAALITVAFSGKGWHIDEPWFLYGARHILTDPLHPFDFELVIFGRLVPFWQESHHPPGLHYLLALALNLVGDHERLLRLLMLPFDLAAAAGLYALARRFLKQPLLPTLLVIATPAYLINVPHLMAEKYVAAFGFWALWFLVRALDKRDDKSLWLSAALFGACGLFKYNAVMLITGALAYAYFRGLPRLKLAAYAALIAAPPALWVIVHQLTGHSEIASVAGYTMQGWGNLTHRLRALLAFGGGCLGFAAFWAFGKSAWPAALAALLFLPVFDLVPDVLLVDRLTGIVMACCCAALLWRMATEREGEGWLLWACWTASVLAWTLLYWSITARMILFAAPPMIFFLARTARRQRAVLGGTLALSLALALVDYRFAGAHREAASLAMTQDSERKVWTMAVGGLQYYLVTAGKPAWSVEGGGWSAVGPRDMVVSSQLWRGAEPPAGWRARVWEPQSAIPLRLISLWRGEGGFYSSGFGFLPFSFSREPLERFLFIERS